MATYPPLVAVTGDLLSEPLGALWLTAAFVASRGGGSPLAGLLLAAAVLTRANLLVLIPVVRAHARAPRRAVFAVAALVPVVAWSLNVGAPGLPPAVAARSSSAPSCRATGRCRGPSER